MKWRRLILPFVVVLIAVAVALAVVINAEPEAPTFVYHAEDVLVADVSGEEIAPVFTGGIDLERFAELQVEVGSADVQNDYFSGYEKPAHEARLGRCACPLCASKSAVAGNYSHSAPNPGTRGTRSPKVHVGSVPKGTGGSA